MKIQPLDNTYFTGIFKSKQPKNVSNSNPSSKQEFKTIKVGNYEFIEAPDSRKFFANYPYNLQESYITKDEGFTAYNVTRKDETGSIRQMARFILDNIVVTDFKDDGRESNYFKSGRREKTIIQDCKGDIIKKITYSETDDKVISEIDNYKKGRLSKTTLYYTPSQQDVLSTAKTEVSETRCYKPKKTLNFSEDGNIKSKISYYPNGSVKETVQYKEDGSRSIVKYRWDGIAEQAEEYGPNGKTMSFTLFNGLENVVERIVFNRQGQPIIKYLNDDMGRPRKMFEYDYETGCLMTTIFEQDGLVEKAEVLKTDCLDFEELN